MKRNVNLKGDSLLGGFQNLSLPIHIVELTLIYWYKWQSVKERTQYINAAIIKKFSSHNSFSKSYQINIWNWSETLSNVHKKPAHIISQSQSLKQIIRNGWSVIQKQNRLWYKTSSKVIYSSSLHSTKLNRIWKLRIPWLRSSSINKYFIIIHKNRKINRKKGLPSLTVPHIPQMVGTSSSSSQQRCSEFKSHFILICFHFLQITNIIIIIGRIRLPTSAKSFPFSWQNIFIKYNCCENTIV